MTLEIVLARECLEATCFGAKVLFSVFLFLVRFQVALHVFRISESTLAHRTSVSVHLGFVVGFSVVPTALSVNRNLGESCSTHLRPDLVAKILLQGKHTWRLAEPALLDDSSDANDPHGLWKLGALGCADRTDLVVDVAVAPLLRVSPTCVACCKLRVVGDRYCSNLSLVDHTLGGGEEIGVVSTLWPLYDPSGDSWPFERSSHWLMPLVELCACCASRCPSTPCPELEYWCASRHVTALVKVGTFDGACLCVPR